MPLCCARGNSRPRLSSAPLRAALRPGHESASDWPARIRHRRSEAAVDRDRLAVDIRGVVAREEKAHRREFVRLAGTLQRIELADLVLGAALLGAVEHRLGHAGFDEARAHRVDAYAG